MKLTHTHLDGLYVIEPKVHSDNRGSFWESYNFADFAVKGLETNFAQDNNSHSKRGVLRGLHFQTDPQEQLKLVRCVSGAIYDVAVDIRPRSPTYKQWFGILLTGANRKMLYISEGFAHGFLAMTTADVAYKTNRYYSKSNEGGLRWNDPAIGINWPLLPGYEYLINDRDRSWPLIS